MRCYFLEVRVCMVTIRPVATYGAETRTITVTEKNALRMLERNVIRRIYGPVMENNVWRIRREEVHLAFMSLPPISSHCVCVCNCNNSFQEK
jgi:hypothetical protein